MYIYVCISYFVLKCTYIPTFRSFFIQTCVPAYTQITHETKRGGNQVSVVNYVKAERSYDIDHSTNN